MDDFNARATLERLKLWLGISKDADLAIELGVPYQTISSWKKRNSIPFEILYRIAQDQHLSLDWLFGIMRPIHSAEDYYSLIIGLEEALSTGELDLASIEHIAGSAHTYMSIYHRQVAEIFASHDREKARQLVMEIINDRRRARKIARGEINPPADFIKRLPTPQGVRAKKFRTP